MVAGGDSIGLSSLQIFNGYYESRFPLNNQKLRDALSVAYFPHNFELITRNSVCTFNRKSSISRKPKHNTKDSVENFFYFSIRTQQNQEEQNSSQNSTCQIEYKLVQGYKHNKKKQIQFNVTLISGCCALQSVDFRQAYRSSEKMSRPHSDL